MKIVRHKNFKKQYCKLPIKLRRKVDAAIVEFVKNPINPILRNHKLRGGMIYKRAFSVTGDLRVIFEEHGDYVLVIFLSVETHNQVY